MELSFKAVKTSMNQMEFISVSHITTEAQRNVMVKCVFKAFCVQCKVIRWESWKLFSSQEFTNLPVSCFSAATSTSDLPNWKTSERQMPSRASERSSFETFLERGNKNSELYFTLYFIWLSEDMETMLCRTVSKTF